MGDVERMIDECLADTHRPLSLTGDGNQKVREEGRTVYKNLFIFCIV